MKRLHQFFSRNQGESEVAEDVEILELDISFDDDDDVWDERRDNGRSCEKKDENGFGYTARDYEELKNKLKAAEEVAQATYGVVEELRRVRSVLGAENAVEAAQELVEELRRVRSVLGVQDEMIASLEARNGNLLRISRERANADRGLYPKKQRSGYVVVSSTQKDLVLKDRKKMKVWRTVLQTHYPANLETSFAEDQIQKDLFSEKHLLCDLGITEQYNGTCEMFMGERRWNKNKDSEEPNVVLSYNLHQNFRGKYLEVIVTHTQPLGEIPDDMMP